MINVIRLHVDHCRVFEFLPKTESQLDYILKSIESWRQNKSMPSEQYLEYFARKHRFSFNLMEENRT